MTTLSTLLRSTYAIEGPPGDTGYTGSRGYVGSQGGIGYTGSRGITGYTGSQGARGSLNWIKKTANYTAVHEDAIMADTTTGSFTVTLPLNPPSGTIVIVADGGNWELNNLTIARNGSTIEGLQEDFILNIRNVQVYFAYDGSTWQVYTTIGKVGYTGSQGIVGYTGSRGIIGYTGSQGEIVVENDSTTDQTRFITFVSNSSGVSTLVNVSSEKLTFNPNTGALSATELNSLSDVELKQDIKNILDPFDSLSKIRGVSFVWKDSLKKSYGFIAQEIEEVIPEITGFSNYKTINYSGVIPFLVEAIKELKQEIETIKEKNG